MNLTLTDEQAAVLARILRYYLGELRMEVSQTDAYSMRQDLKHEEALIKDLIGQLEHIEAQAPGQGA